MNPCRFSLGVDLGGTNFRMAVYKDLATLAPDEAIEPVAVVREPVGERRTPEAVVARLAESIESLARDLAYDGSLPVGIGFAGMLQGCDGFVTNSPHFGWRDVAFGELLRHRLGRGFDVVIENDVNVITLGEVRLGAARGASDVLAVFAGTGIGGGIVAGGQLIKGGSGCAAEIGHTKVAFDDSARPCHCGKRGCVEAYVGGRNLIDRVRQELHAGAISITASLAGDIDSVELSHVDEAASKGDSYALALYTEIGPLLGIVLANAVTLLNPSVLLLGGGVLSRTPMLKEIAIGAMHVAGNDPSLANLEIIDAALGDNAGLIGSALCALEHDPASL